MVHRGPLARRDVRKELNEFEQSVAPEQSEKETGIAFVGSQLQAVLAILDELETELQKAGGFSSVALRRLRAASIELREIFPALEEELAGHQQGVAGPGPGEETTTRRDRARREPEV